jgi:hypothetical protein
MCFSGIMGAGKHRTSNSERRTSKVGGGGWACEGWNATQDHWTNVMRVWLKNPFSRLPFSCSPLSPFLGPVITWVSNVENEWYQNKEIWFFPVLENVSRKRTEVRPPSDRKTRDCRKAHITCALCSRVVNKQLSPDDHRHFTKISTTYVFLQTPIRSRSYLWAHITCRHE